MIVYLNGKFIDKAQAAISPDDRGFLFADGIYEVVRAYGGKFFRSDRHLRRLGNGAQALRFGRTDFPELPDVMAELFRANGMEGADGSVYLQITRGAAPRTHQFPPAATPLTIYAAAKKGAAHAPHAAGLKAIVVPDQRWSRCDIKTVSLLPNILAFQQAAEAGADEAIFSRNGVVMEGSHSNVAVVKAGRVITPPLTNHVLPGVTREVLVELCAGLGIGCDERSLLERELLAADEVMACSTSLEISPIMSVNGLAVADGKPGVVTMRLQEAFAALARTIAATA